MLFVASCGKDGDGDNGAGKTENDKLIEQISAKWNINSGSYVSIELDKSGNYIVVKNKPSRATADDFDVIYGVYKVLNTTTIDLVGFGKIAINSISSTSLSVNLTVNGSSTPIALSGQKVDNSTDIPASTKTEQLCRTWEVTKIDGVDASQIPDDEEGSVAEEVYFSAAGTYLIYLRNGGTDLSNWKWFDASQNKLYYSWDFPPVWEEDGEGGGTVEITTLTSSKLVITEQLTAGPSVVELKPTTTPKSSATTTKSAKQPKGFWGRR